MPIQNRKNPQSRARIAFVRRPGVWLIYIVLWTVAGTLTAVQSYVGEAIYPGQRQVVLHFKVPVQAGEKPKNLPAPTFRDHLRWSMEVWYTRAALSLVALWFALKVRITKKNKFKTLPIHLIISVALDVLALQTVAILCHLFEPHHPAFRAELARAISGYMALNLLIYWALLGLAYAWHYYNDLRQEELQSAKLRGELAHARLKVLKAQLHPHFLFNALSSIGTLLHEDPIAAEDMLLRVSHLLRTMLEDTHSQEVSLRKELAILDWHLGIERIRFGDRLTTRIEIEDEALSCAVPHLILQPLVENAIRHGIAKNAGPDELRVSARRAGESLELEVSNSNSILRLSSEEALREGVGLSNSQSRLQALYGDRFSLSLANLAPRGVLAKIVIPFHRLQTEPIPITEFPG
jgi:two-component system LytT family sensor kinase